MSKPVIGPTQTLIQWILAFFPCWQIGRKRWLLTSLYTQRSEWSYTPFLPVCLHGTDKLPLLFPLHKISITMKKCTHVYIKYVHLILYMFRRAFFHLWHITAVYSISPQLYTWAINNKYDGKCDVKGGWIRIQNYTDSAFYYKLHSACWKFVPTCNLVVNDNYDIILYAVSLERYFAAKYSVYPCHVSIPSPGLELSNAKPTHIQELNKCLTHIFPSRFTAESFSTAL
jgi:hypothetical protein